MTDRKEKGSDFEGNPYRQILKFLDGKQVSGIPIKFFSLVIIRTIANYVCGICMWGSSCDIMDVELFEKLGWKRRSCDNVRDPTYKLSTTWSLSHWGTLSL